MNCVPGGEANDCIPFYFDGPLVISLGYLVTAAVFYPFGRAHLKENLCFQIFSFISFLFLIVIFLVEFINRQGLNFSGMYFNVFLLSFKVHFVYY